MTDPNAWRAAYDSLLEVLQAAQQERGRRGEFVPGPDGREELAWVIYERQRMLDAVNELRAKAASSPVTLDAVIRAETTACGHSDYTSKFAIACADLVAA